MAETIDQFYRRAGVKPWTSSKAVPFSNPAPGLIYGVELEIENAVQDWNTAGMQVTTDGSLRNNGLEFITSPMSYSNLAHVLTLFFQRAKMPVMDAQKRLPEAERNYSDRCSVHVHTNAGNLTFEQLGNLCILYQVFEGVLFNFVGNDRHHSIFAVPWSETQLSYQTVDHLSQGNSDVIRNWQKYTALNLLPLAEKGSIEWRHLHGTNDVNTILTWARLIGHIYRMAVSGSRADIEKLVMSLNTTSLYRSILEQVFQDDAVHLRVGDFERLIENGVLNMKYSLSAPKSAKKAAPRQSLAEMAAQFVAVQAQGQAGVAEFNFDPGNVVHEREQPDVWAEAFGFEAEARQALVNNAGFVRPNLEARRAAMRPIPRIRINEENT